MDALHIKKMSETHYTFDYKDCLLSIVVNTTGPPYFTKTPDHPNIHIDTITCSTFGTGNGKKLLYSAIKFLEKEFAYEGPTEVTLRAVSSLDMDRREDEERNKDLEGLPENDKKWEKHKKLINYYRKIGFEVKEEYRERAQQKIGDGYVAPMIARLNTIIRNRKELLEIGNGVLFDNTESSDRYFFYYKPVEASQGNNRQTRRLRLDSTHKCFLKARRLAGNRLQISDIFCKGGGGGDGKILMCTAINFLQEMLGLKDEAEVSLSAFAYHGFNNRSAQGKNKNVDPQKLQEKLVAYYTRTYGFEETEPNPYSHTYGSHMSTTIGTIKAKCAARENSAPRRTALQRLMSWGRNRWATLKRALGREN